MKFVLLGPPGAGKGTHAKVLSEKYGLRHFATGDILRRNIREQTELGKKAKDIIEKGELVSDDLVNKMVIEEIGRIEGSKGFILDGYPRTIGQGEALDVFLTTENLPLDAVLNFNTTEPVVIDRLSGRRVAPSTGRVYHIRNMPPKQEGVCDDTGEKLTQRKDDEPETVRNRLKVYHKETEPLIESYKQTQYYLAVNGNQKPQAVFEEIFAKLGEVDRGTDGSEMRSEQRSV